MEPYYQSWERSTHSDVECIKCHFPPGAAEKVRGKMLGLVQLAKYVTRSEGPRPTADIPDDSCLRSGCHDRRNLGGHIDFHGIPFDHTPHLSNLRHDKELRCTSCHGMLVQGHHMSASTTTCFLCHFKDTHFNEGVGACTRCHQIPEEKFDLGGGIEFSHELAYEKGVDCRNCHGDLIRGNGEVASEKCRVCHNREEDIQKLDDHKLMHQLHVTAHKVECFDCHQPIEHSLGPEKLVHAASDCDSCHPNHHREQVDMLQGLGGKSLSDQAATMLATRVECKSCHRVMEASPTGVLWKASADVCTTCHSSTAVEQLQSYVRDLDTSLAEIEAAVEVVQSAIDTTDMTPGRAAELEAELGKVKDDLSFLKIGNGIHNIHYATTLASALRDELATLCLDLGIPEPKITLPEYVEPLDPNQANHRTGL